MAARLPVAGLQRLQPELGPCEGLACQALPELLLNPAGLLHASDGDVREVQRTDGLTDARGCTI